MQETISPADREWAKSGNPFIDSLLRRECAPVEVLTVQVVSTPRNSVPFLDRARRRPNTKQR